jgi:hypothetical protein
VNPLASMQAPDSAVIPMSTLTPLYTGGIGQCGEQLHPSGLLGSIRHFSCLVARAVGEAEFEKRVWGEAGKSQKDTQAKQVGIRWDAGGLQEVPLPEKVIVEAERSDGQSKKSTWYFNRALQGNCKLILIRRGISDKDWQLLLLALRIQIRHATFGAKDQFGLGVMACERLPAVAPLPVNNVQRPSVTNTLWHSAFFNLKLMKPGKTIDPLSCHEALELGLNVRYALRNALRGFNGDRDLRHQMMGALNEYGSATNVSAAYPADDSGAMAVRVVVQLKPAEGASRTKVMQAFNQALNGCVLKGCRVASVGYQWGGGIGSTEKHQFKNISDWINHLAGV